jgi:DNA excision repair protein ERCC-4
MANLSPARLVRVVVDDRETTFGPLEFLKQTPGVELTVQRLPVGDYELNRRLLFERKTLVDFAVSIQDGRLFRQAVALANSPLLGVLILEGTASDLAKSKMRREALQGALISVSLILRIPVLRSLGAQESAQLMLYADRQLSTLTSGAFPRKSRRPKGKKRVQLALLQGLPGVGPERALSLLEAFGTVQSVVPSSFQDLLKVRGIGQGTAKAIRWAVSEAEEDYRRVDIPVPEV